MLKPGSKRLNWNSLGIQDYITKCEQVKNHMEESLWGKNLRLKNCMIQDSLSFISENFTLQNYSSINTVHLCVCKLFCSQRPLQSLSPWPTRSRRTQETSKRGSTSSSLCVCSSSLPLSLAGTCQRQRCKKKIAPLSSSIVECGGGGGKCSVTSS